MADKIRVFIESQDGHEEKEVSQEKVGEEVKKQLEDGRWVSVEKRDGGKELLTQKDLPKENPEENMKWAERFENTESVTSTKTVKGG